MRICHAETKTISNNLGEIEETLQLERVPNIEIAKESQK